MSLKALTANRLGDGHPVWYGADGEWVRDIDRAAVADTQQACAALEQAGRQALAANEVIDVALIDVEYQGSRLHALRLRERIRATGPTVACGGCNRHV